MICVQGLAEENLPAYWREDTSSNKNKDRRARVESEQSSLISVEKMKMNNAWVRGQGEPDWEYMFEEK